MNFYRKAATAIAALGLYVAASSIVAKNSASSSIARKPSHLEEIAETAGEKKGDIAPLFGCIATGLFAAGLLYGTLRQRKKTKQ